MTKNPDFWKVLLGSGTLGAFLAYMLIAFICVVVSVLIDISSRDVASTHSPVKFSWNFALTANLARFMANILCVPICIRLVYEYVDPKWMLFLAVVIGILVDRLALWLKNIGILTFDKLTEKIKNRVSSDDHAILPSQNQQS
ncbi:MAG TPA: hypothetical protein VGM31_14200 [Puia sp.]|jgi:uncharacterized membrane protein YkvI